ncbi:MAG: hypothetical protein K2N56_02955 [Oscillospiraceae bacterium]|nr:hypothetical protein [Oscillospiraceae bacterium]
MKTKTVTFALFAGSAAFINAFAVKTLVDWRNYRSSINSAPFSVWILMNALYFIVPAVILSAAALFVLGKTRVLCVCGVVFAAAAVDSAILSGSFPDCLIYAVPAAVSAIVCGIFALISRKRLTWA